MRTLPATVREVKARVKGGTLPRAGKAARPVHLWALWPAEASRTTERRVMLEWSARTSPASEGDRGIMGHRLSDGAHESPSMASPSEGGATRKFLPGMWGVRLEISSLDLKIQA